VAEGSGIGKRRSAAKEEATFAYQTRRRGIVEAAVRVFNRDGFKGASISSVAAEPNIVQVTAQGASLGSIDLTATRDPLTQHKNKFGEDYPKTPEQKY